VAPWRRGRCLIVGRMCPLNDAPRRKRREPACQRGFPAWLLDQGFLSSRPDAHIDSLHVGSLQSPVPITLTVRFADGRSRFRPGETLPIELEFESRVPKRFVVDGATYDRSGRLTIDEFRVEPDDGVTDPLPDYFASGGFIGGGIRGIGVLGDKPFLVRLDLNEWFYTRCQSSRSPDCTGHCVRTDEVCRRPRHHDHVMSRAIEPRRSAIPEGTVSIPPQQCACRGRGSQDSGAV
jgi:hypothetical protein